MAKIVVKTQLSGKPVQTVVLESAKKGMPLRLKIRPDVDVALVFEDVLVLPDAIGSVRQLETTRDGDDLNVSLDSKVVLQLSDYYADTTQATKDAPSMTLSSDVSAYLSNAQFYTPDQISQSHGVFSDGQVQVVQRASWTDASLGWLGGLLAVAVGAGGGGGGGGNSVPVTKPAGEEMFTKTVNGTVMAGPVNAAGSDDLIVLLYDQNGRLLQSAAVKADGAFTLSWSSSSNYSGALLVKVISTVADGNDYWNEMGGQKDMPALRAVVNLTGDVANVYVTPLTEYATKLMGVAVGDTTPISDVARIKTVNHAVATKFAIGGDDVTSVLPVASVNADGSSNASVNDYGKALVLISAAELKYSASTDSVLDAILSRDTDYAQSALLGNDARVYLTQAVSGATSGVQSALSGFPLLVSIPRVTLQSDTGISSSDGITSNPNISVSTSASGVQWQYSTDAGGSWTDGVGSGFSLQPGLYAANTVWVKEFDSTSNAFGAEVKLASALNIVTASPTAPNIALEHDTGPSGDNGDGISSNGQVNVTGLQADATWSFTTNGNDATPTWQAGTGSSFTLGQGRYDIGALKVKQIDKAGNESARAEFASVVIIDTDALAPSISLVADTGVAGDGITGNGSVSVAGLEAGASWQYTTNGNAASPTWVTGTGTSFVLAENTYLAGAIRVKQTDKAGNTSGETSNSGDIIVQTTVPSLNLTLAHDTGVSSDNTDQITKDSTVNITGLVAGATWEYSLNSGATWQSGTGTSFSLSQAKYSANAVQARQTDSLGNVSPIGYAPAWTVDTQADTLTLKLAYDTGLDTADGVSNNGTINVIGIEAGATWQYTFNADAANPADVVWHTGSDNSFLLDAGSYAVGSIQVKQTDVAGNTTITPAQNTAQYTITRTIVAPNFSLAQDSGASDSDGFTKFNTINVSSIEDGATWEFSLDSGRSWSSPQASSVTSFTLTPGVTYPVNAIQVRQTNSSGVISPIQKNSLIINVDTSATLPTLSLEHDTSANGDNTDGITSNGTMIVGGLEDGAAWQYTTNGNAASPTWATGTGTSFVLAENTYLAGAIRVKQTDKAGNTSAEASNIGDITVDTTIPSLSLSLETDSGINGDHITNVGTINVAGLELGATWQYSLDSGVTWQNGTNTSFTLPEASYSAGAVQVKQTDVAGGASGIARYSTAIQVDQHAATPSLNLAVDSGTNTTDGVSNQNIINVSGLEDGATWQYTTTGNAATPTWQTGTGNSFIVGQGSYPIGALKVKQTDKAGNASSEASNTSSITIDISAAAPGLSLAHDTSATGVDNTDAISKDGTVNVIGIETDATWSYSVDGGSTWISGSSAIAGNASFTLAQGYYASNMVQVKQTDKAGNPSAPQILAGDYTIDTQVSKATLILTTDTGSNAADGITANGRISVLNLDADATWQYTTNGNATAPTWQTGVGVSFTLGAGSYVSGDIQVKQTDVAGNLSTGVITTRITIDASPDLPTLSLANDTGTDSTDGISSNGTVNVGNLQTGATWQYSLDGGKFWADGEGTSFTLASGHYAQGLILVHQTDLAGNPSADVQFAQDITVDQIAALPQLGLGSDTGASSTDHISKDGTITVLGLESGATWQYSTDVGVTWVQGSGTSFSLSPNTTYAADRIQVVQTDKAGNLSFVGKLGYPITIDTLVADPSLALNFDSGTAGDGITSDGVINVSGLELGAQWFYSDNNGGTWQSGTGSSFSLSPGAYAAGVVQVKQTDAAGNTSQVIHNLGPVTISTTAAAPTIALRLDAGISSTDGITNDPRVIVTGLENGATWEYSTDGGSHWSMPTPGSNYFDLQERSYTGGTIQVRQTNVAGSLSGDATIANRIVVDQTVATPSLTLVTDTGVSSSDRITNNGTFRVAGLEDGASWEYSIDNGSTWNPGSGTSFTLATNSYTSGQVQVRQTDVAGTPSNQGAFNSSFTIDTDTATPILTLHSDTGTQDGLTSNGQIDVTGLEIGGTWQYSLDGGTSWVNVPGVITNASASFTLPEGSYVGTLVRARQTDVAGTLSGEGRLAQNVQIVPSVRTPGLALVADTGADNTDGLSTNGKILVTGLEDGTTWEYTTNGNDTTPTWSIGTGNSFTLSEGVYAANGIQVKQTNLSVALTSDIVKLGTVVIIDQHVAAPSLALLHDTGVAGDNTDGITSNGTLNVSGLEDGASWQYSVDGGTSWATGGAISASGTSSFTLIAGTYSSNQVQVRQTDKAGNSSNSTAFSGTLVVDTQIQTLGMSLASDTGVSNSDFITNNPNLQITGIENGATWQYRIKAGGSSMGAWSDWTAGTGSTLALSSGTTYSENTIEIRQTDLAGTTSNSTSNTQIYKIDQSVAMPSLSLAQDTTATVGVTDNDGISSNGLINVTGLEDGATWQYSVDGGTFWANGTSSQAFTLAVGTYTAGKVLVRQTDVAGTTSNVGSNASTIVIDQSAAPPEIRLSNDTGVSSNDGITRIATVNVVGLENGATWEYTTDGNDTTPIWNIGTGGSFDLPNVGSYTAGSVQVRQTDKAGNHSAAGGSTQTLTLDQAADAPSLRIYTDTGTPGDNISSQGQVQVNGLESGATWQYRSNNGSGWSAWITGTGNTFVLAEGVYNTSQIEVQQTDKAGNPSISGVNTTSITIDQTIATPTLSVADLAGGFSNTGIVTVSYLEDGASWEYSIDNGMSWIKGSGNSFNLPAGDYLANDIQVKQTDKAGNSNDVTAKFSQNISTGTASATLSLMLSADTGLGSNDGVSNNGTVNVVGIDSNATSWEYTTNANDSSPTWHTGTPKSAFGRSSFTLAEGTYASGAIGIRQIISSIPTSTIALGQITIDKTVGIPSVSLVNDTGTSGSDGVTSSGLINVTGLEVDATWQYSTDAGGSWSAGGVISAAGTSSFTVGTGVYPANNIRVRQTDKAGNTNAIDAKISTDITVDSLAITPTLRPLEDTGSSNTDRITSNTTIVVDGIETDATWRYSTDRGATWSTGTTTAGASQFTVSPGSYSGDQLQVEQTDRAGNISAKGVLTSQVVIDTTISACTLRLSQDTGIADGITTNGLIIVEGLEVGSSWQYSIDNGGNWIAGQTSTQGVSSFILPSNTYAAGSILVKQTDLAGNSTTSSAYGRNDTQITVDSIANPPTIALHADTGTNSSDGISSNGQIDVSGLEEGATWQYSTDGGVTWTAAPSSATSFSLAVGSYAATKVQVKQTDKAGNTSVATSNSSLLQITNGVSVPTLALQSDSGSDSNDYITNNSILVVGNIDVGATWEYSIDSGLSWLVGANNTIVLTGQTYAAGVIQVRQTSAAGQTSSTTSNTHSIIIDTQASAPVAVLANDTGASATDGISTDGTITVSGLEQGATWQYSTTSGASWVSGGSINADGTSSFILNTPDTYVGQQIRVKQTDKAGNESAVGKILTSITINDAAAELSLRLQADTGSSSSDFITYSNTVRVIGVASGATWQYTTDNTAATVIWQTGFGNTFTLDEGTYGANKIAVRQTTQAGSTSNAISIPHSIVIDFSVLPPTLSLAGDTGASNIDGISANGTINVGIESGASWEYSYDGGINWLAGTGTSFELEDGIYSVGSVQTRQTDVAGNISGVKRISQALVIDKSVQAPSIALVTDTGTNSVDGITSVGTVSVLGLEAGATWAYSKDRGANWTAGTGTGFNLGAGVYLADDIQVKQTDKAGNTSSVGTNASRIEVDLSVATPTIALTTDSGTNTSDHITKIATITVSNLEANSVWQYSRDSGNSWAIGSGSTFTLIEGTYAANSIQVKQVDKAGNPSATGTNAEQWVIDQYTPAPSLSLANDTGSSSVDGISSDGTINIGNIEVGATWEYRTSPTAGWTAGTGTTFALAEKTYAIGDIQIRQTDKAGNTSLLGSNVAQIVIDKQAAAPIIALAIDTGSSNNDRITSNGLINVTGLEIGTSWEYSIDGGRSWIAGATALTGTTSFSVSGGANAGITYAAGTIQVKQTDLAGNTSAVVSNQLPIVIDTQSAAPTLSLAADTGNSSIDGITKNNQVNVADLETGATWEYSINSGVDWSAGSGTSFTLTSGQTYAANTIAVRQTDKAGNVSSLGRYSNMVVVDTSIASLGLTLAADTGNTTDGITSNTLVNVSNIETGATWSYSLDNGYTWTPGVAPTAGGTASFNLQAGTTYSAGYIQAKQIDTAGNDSGVTSLNPSSTITVDTTILPLTLALATDSGLSNTDGISNVGTINVGNIETGATWSYSIDAGGNWTVGSTAVAGNASFTLASGTYISGGIQVKQTDKAGNTSAITKTTTPIVIDASSPSDVDLSSALGVLATESQFYIGTQSGSNAALLPNIIQPSDTDIAKITVVASGASLDTTNDQFVFGSVSQLLGSSAAGSNLTVNTVNAVDWSYSSANKTLTLTKTGGGAFTSAEVQKIEQGLSFKTINAATQGARTFTITHADQAGNSGNSATETVTVDTNIGAVDLNSSILGYQNTENQNYTSANAGNNKQLFPNVALPTEGGDILKISLAVTGINDATNDQLKFGATSQTINAISSSFNNITINSVTGVNCTYDGTNKTFTFTLNSGSTFTDGQVQLIEKGLNFYTTTAASQGARSFTLTHIDRSGNSSSSATESVNVDTSISPIDLDAVTINTQSSEAQFYASVNAGATKILLPNIALTTDTDIAQVAIAAGGAGLDPSSDYLYFGSISTLLGSSVSSGTNITIGTVTGINWSYSGGTSKTITFSKLSGLAFTPLELQIIEKDLRFKTSASPSAGTRTFTVAHIDLMGNSSATATESVTVDTTIGAVDLDSVTSNTQNTLGQFYASTNLGANKTLLPSIAQATDSDIAKITIVAGGTSLDNSNDQLIFGGVTQTLNSTAASGTATVGGVAVNWSYTTGKALSFSKTSGAFTAAEVLTLEQAISFKTSSTTQGARDFAITHTDLAGNVSASATQTVTVDTTIGAVDLALTAGTQSTESQYYYTAASAGTLKALLPNVSQPTDTDIASITVLLGGSVDASNDVLAFGGLTPALGTSVASNTATINTVSVNWSYSSASKTFVFNKASGPFTAAEVQKIEQGLSFKTASTATQGARTFTITHADAAGNNSASATETVTVDFTSPAAVDLDAALGGTQATASQYYAYANLGTSKTLFPSLVAPSETDIAQITITAAGTLDTASDTFVIGSTTKTLNTTSGSGSNVVINGLTGVNWDYSSGKVLTLSKYGGGVFSALEVQTIAKGIAFQTTTNTQGSRTFAVAFVDATGNTSNSATMTVNVDTVVASPTLALHTDSGTSNTDNNSNIGTVDVTFASDKVSWTYSLDGGNTWITSAGASASFTLPAGIYVSGNVQVKQTDAAGNTSAVATLVTTIDQTAPAVSLANTSAGFAVSLAESTATNGVVNITAENGAGWVVTLTSANGSVTLSGTGTGAAQAVTLNSTQVTTLGQGAVTVTATATDTAGNATTANSGGNFTLDTIAPILDMNQADGSTLTNYIANVISVSTPYAVTNTTSATTKALVTEVNPIGSVTITVNKTVSASTLSGETLTLGNVVFTLDGLNPPPVLEVAGQSWNLAYTSNSSLGIFTFTPVGGPVSSGLAQSLVRAGFYSTNTTLGTTQVRILSFSLTDTAGNTSNTATASFTADNVGPVLDLNGAAGGVDFTPSNITSGTLNTLVNITSGPTTVETSTISSLAVRISGIANAANETLTIGSSTYALDGTSVPATTLVSGTTWNSSYANATLTFSLSAGSATTTQLNALMAAMQYKNAATSGAALDGLRTFSFVATDSVGNTSAAAPNAFVKVNVRAPAAVTATTNSVTLLADNTGAIKASTGAVIVYDADKNGTLGDQFDVVFTEPIAVTAATTLSNWTNNATLGTGATITAVDAQLVSGVSYATTFHFKMGTGSTYITGSTFALTSSAAVDTGGTSATANCTFTLPDISAPLGSTTRTISFTTPVRTTDITTLANWVLSDGASLGTGASITATNAANQTVNTIANLTSSFPSQGLYIAGAGSYHWSGNLAAGSSVKYGHMEFRMGASDGVLRLYQWDAGFTTATQLWTLGTPTTGATGYIASMQPDGNVVIYNGATPISAIGAPGGPDVNTRPAYMAIQEWGASIEYPTTATTSVSYASSFTVNLGAGASLPAGTSMSISRAKAVSTTGLAYSYDPIFDISAIPPSPPVDISTDNYISAAERMLNTNLTYSGTFAGDILYVYRDGVFVKTVSATATNTTFTLSGDEWGTVSGQVALTVKAADANGNFTGSSISKQVIVDTQLDTGFTSVRVTSDVSTVGQANQNDIIQFTFAEPVKIPLTTAAGIPSAFGTGATAVAVADVNGFSRVWNITLGASPSTTLASGVSNFQFTGVTDVAGNSGSIVGNIPSSIFSNPDAPIIDNVATNNVISNAERNAAQPIKIGVTGLAQNDVVKLYMDGILVNTVTASSTDATNQFVSLSVASNSWGADGTRVLTSTVQRGSGTVVSSVMQRNVYVAADSAHWSDSNILWFDPEVLALSPNVNTWKASAGGSTAARSSGTTVAPSLVRVNSHLALNFATYGSTVANHSYYFWSAPTEMTPSMGTASGVSLFGATLQPTQDGGLDLYLRFGSFGNNTQTTNMLQLGVDNRAFAGFTNYSSYPQRLTLDNGYPYGADKSAGTSTWNVAQFNVFGGNAQWSISSNGMLQTKGIFDQTAVPSFANQTGTIASDNPTHAVNMVLGDQIIAGTVLSANWAQEINLYLSVKYHSVGRVWGASSLNATYDLSVSKGSTELINDVLLLSEDTLGIGNDTITTAGTDYVSAGSGNDTVILTDALFRDLDGGKGTDTLRLSASYSGPSNWVLADNVSNARGNSANTSDNTRVNAAGFHKLQGFEVIDLSASTATQVLTVAAADVNQLSEDNNLWVKLGAEDALKTSGFSSTTPTLGYWTHTETDGTTMAYDRNWSTPKVRYVRVYHTAQAYALVSGLTTLTLTGLKVLATDGTDVASGHTVSSGADTGTVIAGAFNPSTLTDGSYGGGFNSIGTSTGSNLAWVTTGTASDNPYINLDLGAAYDVSSIRLWGRGDVTTESDNLRIFVSDTAFGSSNYATLSSTKTYYDLGTVDTAASTGTGGTAATTMPVVNLYSSFGDYAPSIKTATYTGATATLTFDSTITGSSVLADWQSSTTGGNATVVNLSSTGVTLTFGSTNASGVVTLTYIGTQLTDTYGQLMSYGKVMIGTSALDVFNAASNTTNTAMFSNGGSDVMLGGSGNDLLSVSGIGDVVLLGAKGADTFAFALGSSGTATLTDFKKSEGDKINLASLLSQSGMTANNMSNYLQLTQSTNDALLKVDADGNGNFNVPAMTMTITGGWATGGLNDPLTTLVNQHVIIVA